MDIFVKAAKNKYRFQTSKGNLSTEDLWDLSLESLDLIAKRVNKDIKASEEESFIKDQSAADKELIDKLEVIKYIIKYKIGVKEAAAKRAETLAKKDELQKLIADKKAESLKNLSLQELEAMEAQLEA